MMHSIRDSPIVLLRHSSHPTLALWGGIAEFVFPIALLGGPVLLGLVVGQPFGSFPYNFVGVGYLILLSMVGLIALRTGRLLARMSDEQRAAALPESLVATGRTSKGYWERQAIFGALFAAATIIFIVLIVAGVI
jgi:hypothetical protein